MRTFTLASALLFGTVPAVLSATIDVTVGGSSLTYSPSSVNANVGDIIRFTFQQKNHTVTQSSLAQPCQPIANGFDTGFIPVASTTTSGFPIAELTITTTSPVWAYCRQGNHCQQGMVFAVNPGDKFAAFQQAATGGGSPASVTIQPVSTSTSATATSSSTSAISTPTTPSSTDHKVIVGGPNTLIFNPANITAQVGDTITFEFHEKNHTVTQSSFAAPCRNLFSTSGTAGFDSGFEPVASGATTFPTYTIQVNSTTPIWAYCKQSNHCGSGMVFAVNAVESSSKSFEAFQALAKQLNGTSTTSSSTPTSSSGARPISSSVYTTSGIALFALIGSWFL